jgi:hypothetical protein
MQHSNNQRVYRFKFSDYVTNIIYKFAKLHQFDDRQTYKEAWVDWCESNDDDIRREVNRLIELGYDGNVEDKMYKSGRYYFRNKSTNEIDPCKRRAYVSTSVDLIDSMESHIKMHNSDPDYTPANGYDDFCKNYKVELVAEIEYLKQNDITDQKEIACKIKKAYKNRYFQFIKSK